MLLLDQRSDRNQLLKLMASTMQNGGIKTKYVKMALTISLLSGLTTANAQDPNGAIGVPIGETDLYPTVTLAYETTDNVFLSSNAEIAADAIIVEPIVKWIADRRLLTLEAEYRGKYSSGSESVLDFDDHKLSFAADIEYSKRTRFNSEVTFASLNETQNLADLSTSNGVDNFNYQEYTFSNSLRYGANQAKGNVRLKLDLRSFIPGSNASLFRTQRYESSTVKPSIAFSLRISPDTRWVNAVAAEFATFPDTPLADNTTATLSTGLEFSQTGVVGGEATIGYSETNNDTNSVINNSTTTINVELFYRPLSFSQLTLSATRGFDFRSLTQSTAQDSQSVQFREDIVTKLDFLWNYDYSERFSHSVSIGGTSVERECPDTFNELKLSSKAELFYTFRRWLKLGAGIQKLSRSVDGCTGSNEAQIADLDYDLTRLSLVLKASL